MKSLTFLSKKITFMNMPKNGQPCQINIKVAEFVLGLGLWTPTNPHCSPKNKFFYFPWGSSCAEQYPICVWNTKLQKLTSVNGDGLKSFISCLSWVSTLACFKLLFGLSISSLPKTIISIIIKADYLSFNICIEIGWRQHIHYIFIFLNVYFHCRAHSAMSRPGSIFLVW